MTAPRDASTTALPARPRLADHVVARRHVVDGEPIVLLRDLASGVTAAVGPREWAVLAAADGTRDLDGIVLAAAAEGAHVGVDAAAEFLSRLAVADLLAGDPPEAPRPVDEAREALAIPKDRALDPLPGYRFSCDGRGACCAFYGTVVFTPLDAARARAFAPHVLDAGEAVERAFTPERGVRAPGLAVASVDGRCAYLDAAGRCSIHAAGGEAVKPLGCRLFPARFVDDGETVRVGVAVECACVLASVGRAEGAPIGPPGARVVGDLDPCIHVASLAEGFAVTEARAASRVELVAWSRELVAAAPPTDGVAAAWALADAIAAHGLARREGAPADFPRGVAPPAPGVLAPLIARLADRAAARAHEDAAWGGDRLLAGRAVLFVHATATALLEPELCAMVLASPERHAAHEAFYLRALLHGHELVGPLPLADALRDRAVRMLVARALPLGRAAVGDDGADPALAYPLAVVEATLRGHGLASYYPGS